MKDFVLSESVARKLAQTFVESEVMQTAVTQFIPKPVYEAITDAVDKRTAENFTEKMRLDDKPTDYPAGNRTTEPKMDIIIPEEDLWSSSGG